MQLCVNSFRTLALAAMMTTAVSACKRPVNFIPVSKEFVQPRTTKVLDSLVKEGENVAENSDYIYLGGDTLELNKDFPENPTKFFDKTTLILNDKFNEKICTEHCKNIYGYPESSQIIKHKNCPNIYIDKTAIIPSAQIYTIDSTALYIPVEYYGKVNPEIYNFL